MRITGVEPLICDAGFGPRRAGDLGTMGRHGWIFVKVTTDEGITGWAEAYDWHAPPALAETIRVVGREFIGADPRQIERINQRVWCRARPGMPERIKVLARARHRVLGHQGEVARRAGLRVAWRKFHDRIPLYWSHFASYRAVWPEVLAVGPRYT